jgi:hypothetical protein
MQFAIDLLLAHAARYQLRDLRAEIEDEDFLVGHGLLSKEKRRPRPPSEGGLPQSMW